MIKMVIFDMAGTAIDEDNIVYKTISSVLNEFGMEVGLDLVLLHGAGKEKWQAIHDILQQIDGVAPPNETVTELYHHFQVKLDSVYEIAPMQLFEPLPDVIRKLRSQDIKVVFNTGYSRPVAEKILKKVNCRIDRDIDALITASDVLRGRPAPDMIWKACDQFNLKPNQTVKIGDSQIDIEEGRNAGAKYCIGITTGAQCREVLEKANPDYVIDNVDELWDILSLS
ncbi:MAG: HAD-IA family hydrolase [Saprospiraceae bacterium]|nr:HAD-IA family hydrolase [Saprospiraceae bacterium]